MPSIVPRRYLRRREAAAYVCLSETTLAIMASKGRGPTYSRLGKVTVYSVDDLDKWISDQRRTSPRDLLGPDDGGRPAATR